MLLKSKIPQFVSHVTIRLQEAGFEAYLVGGCVRDLLMEKNPKDWDLTTNAKPQEIESIFKEIKTVYENKFGTVTIISIPKEEENRTVSHEICTEIVQVTTYRSESHYSDNRHPDSVSYETLLDKDLERRDFTMNAIAWDPIKDSIKDIFGGIKDIKDKTIKSVLYPDKRFDEDALRMLRAIRFSTTLNFAIEKETLASIVRNSEKILKISSERITDEFLKIIDSKSPALGIDLLQKSNLLRHMIPELEQGIGCEQKGAHIYDVYNHSLHALQHSADKNFSTAIRLSALFHDIGKPTTRRYDKIKDKYTFFGHEVVGARMTKKILDRLKVPRETSDLVVSMVRNHMFFSDTEQITLSAVRRIIQKVKPEHIWELMNIRECDRVGMKKTEAPYRLRKYHAMIEEVMHDPISVGQLCIDGSYMIEVLHMKPGPRMGWILHALLEEILDTPELNTKEILTEKIKKLDILSDEELKIVGEKGKDKKEELEDVEIKKLHQKHGIKKTL